MVRYVAIEELQSMLKRYQEELDCCTDGSEGEELIDVVETLEWVIKEFDDPCQALSNAK